MILLPRIIMIYLFYFTLGQCYKKVKITGVPKNVVDQIYLIFFKGNMGEYVKIKLEDGLSIPNYRFFKTRGETMFHFPGWGEVPPKIESIISLSNAFAQQKKDNFIVLDYSPFVTGGSEKNYVLSTLNVTMLGKVFGQYFKQYIDNAQPADTVRLISHSLGSQIMSRTANYYAPRVFNSLTALDPAGPLFTLPGVPHLTKSDGKFVQVIHTDGGHYGDGRTIGHVDFFPNNGSRVQPYCNTRTDDEYCSHHMSWRYYAESVNSEKAFPGRKCIRDVLCELDLTKCLCLRIAPFEYMGYGVNTMARGTYFMKTNDKSPFGLGIKGTDF